MHNESATDWLGLASKRVVVTGAGGGIGLGIASSLVEGGAHVAMIDVDRSKAESAAKSLAGRGGRATGVCADVSDRSSVRGAVEAICDALGGVDVLVCNAGVVGASDLMSVTADEWDRVMGVNLTGALYCTQEFSRGMVDQGHGSIIHISSFCSTHHLPNSGAYSSSKAAVRMLSEGFAVELAPYGVRSNSIAPGLIRTPLTEGTYADPELHAAKKAIVPLLRIGNPSDIADTVLWLASDRASYVTGVEIPVDGGLSKALGSMIPGREVTSVHG